MTKINSALLILFILLLPTQLGKHFFLSFSYLSGVRVDYLAPTIYLIDLVAFCLLLLNMKVVFRFFWQKKFLFFLLLISLNLIISQSPLISLYQYLKIFEFLVIYIIFKKTRLAAKTFLLSLTLTALVQLVLAVSQFISKQSLQGIFYFLGERYFTLSTPAVAKASFLGIEILRPYASFSHPNSLAGFFLLLYTFVLSANEFKKLGFLKQFFLFISSLLIFLSFSKISIIIFLLINIFYFIVNTKKVCRLCFLAKIIILSLLSLIFFQAKSDPLSLFKRWFLIKNSLLIISQHYFLGVGAGNYLVAQNKLAKIFSDSLNQPVHNVFLLLISEWGVISFSLILYLVLFIIKSICKKNPWLLAVFFITAFFDHYWLTLNQNFLLLAVILGRL